MKIGIPDIDKKAHGFHLSGIIPISSEAFRFDYQWPSCLTPIDEEVSFLEYAIYKCLCLGCDSIWLAMERKGYRLVREQVGEYAKSAMKGWVPEERRYKRSRVPIYYWFKSSPGPRKYRYCSLITKNIEMSRRIVNEFSAHLVPNRFYIAFPSCIVNLDEVVDYRRKFIGKKTIPKTLFEDQNNRTVKDGDMIDFICEAEDERAFHEKLKLENTGFVSKSDAEKTRENVKYIFSEYVENDAVNYYKFNSMNIVRSWRSYKKFLSKDFNFGFPEWELVSGDFKYRSLYDEDSN